MAYQIGDMEVGNPKEPYFSLRRKRQRLTGGSKLSKAFNVCIPTGEDKLTSNAYMIMYTSLVQWSEE